MAQRCCEPARLVDGRSVAVDATGRCWPQQCVNYQILSTHSIVGLLHAQSIIKQLYLLLCMSTSAHTRPSQSHTLNVTSIQSCYHKLTEPPYILKLLLAALHWQWKLLIVLVVEPHQPCCHQYSQFVPPWYYCSSHSSKPFRGPEAMPCKAFDTTSTFTPMVNHPAGNPCGVLLLRLRPVVKFVIGCTEGRVTPVQANSARNQGNLSLYTPSKPTYINHQKCQCQNVRAADMLPLRYLYISIPVQPRTTHPQQTPPSNPVMTFLQAVRICLHPVSQHNQHPQPPQTA